MFDINKRLDEALSNQNADYNMPFLWMKGEERSLISREIDKIYEALQKGVGGKEFRSATHKAVIRKGEVIVGKLVR